MSVSMFQALLDDFEDRYYEEGFYYDTELDTYWSQVADSIEALYGVTLIDY